MVVSYISALRSKADVALGMTNGARLMLSEPPAMIRSDSPPRIARAAIATASSPEPHRRFRVTPPQLSGRPPGHAALRPRVRVSSPPRVAPPEITSLQP